MRIIGIDPGIARTGWGIVDKQGQKATAVAYGCIETPKEMPFPERLEMLYIKITEVLTQYTPEAMGIEDLFFASNAKTAMVVGQARGVVLLVGAQNRLPIMVYTPLQVKIAVTGYGRADKAQVGQMVKTLLKLPEIPTPDDTADALAIAITHAFSAQYA